MTAAKRQPNLYLDKDAVLDAARGRWQEIYLALAGVTVSKQQGPCPRCGGSTRCRLSDLGGNGSIVCNHDCFPKVGDGLSGIGQLLGISFPEVLELVGKHLGLAPGGGSHSRTLVTPAATASNPVGPNGHASNGQSQRTPKPKATRKADVKFDPAPPEVLHQVYAKILSYLPLSDTHRQNLRGRGLSDELIDAEQLRTLDKASTDESVACLAAFHGLNDTELFERIPGIVPFQLQAPSGILIPCRNLAGQIIALKIRRDQIESGENRYCYVSTQRCSCGSPAHIPLLVGAGPHPRVRVTEGELKSLVATLLSGVPTIACPGVNGWRKLIPNLQEVNAETVLLSFDADCYANRNVATQLSEAFAGLTAAEFEVELEIWDPEDGKGIDDLLAAGKAPEVLTGEDAIERLQQICEAADAAEQQKAGQANGELIERLRQKLCEGVEAFFSDDDLLKSLAVLSRDDASKFSIARSIVKSAKISMTDFNSVMKQHAPPALRERSSTLSEDNDHGFAVIDGSLCIVSESGGEESISELANYSAEIIDETVRDDGIESKITFGIVGKLADGRVLPRIDVSSTEFQLGEWQIKYWGAGVIHWKGRTSVLPGIQVLSKNKIRRQVYVHTGWRKIDDCWVYLHAGGAIGWPKSCDPISVDLQGPLSKFSLPDPSAIPSLADSVQATVRFLMMADGRLTFPLLAAAFRAVVGGADFSVHLAGQSGVFKSELATLIQQFFGAGFTRLNLPANWASTANANEGTAFLAKDAILVVDDYVPHGGANEAARLHREAERLLRGQGNNAGRNRMNRDGTLQPSRPPRGLMLSTGEDIPPGQSLRARIFILEVSYGDITSELLTECQADAAAGLYAETMAAFIAWLAPQYDEVQANWKTTVAEIRRTAAGRSIDHARTPANVAELFAAFQLFLRFTESTGILGEAMRRDLSETCWESLNRAGSTQAQHQAENDPAKLYMRLMKAAIASGRVHIAGLDGGQPDSPGQWGWRKKQILTSTGSQEEWQATTQRVGWTDGEHVYLEPEIAFAEVQKLARDQGTGIGITEGAMRVRLRDAEFLATTDEKRATITKRKTIEKNSRKEVLWLKIEIFMDLEIEVYNKKSC